MGRVVNWVYGLLIIYVALDALFIQILPEALLPFIVILLGLLVFFTPLDSPRYGIYASGTPRSGFQWLRTYVFGVYMVLSGLLSFTGLLNVPYGAYASTYTFSGQLILLLIGTIYLLSNFTRTRNIQLSSI